MASDLSRSCHVVVAPAHHDRASSAARRPSGLASTTGRRPLTGSSIIRIRSGNAPAQAPQPVQRLRDTIVEIGSELMRKLPSAGGAGDNRAGEDPGAQRGPGLARRRRRRDGRKRETHGREDGRRNERQRPDKVGAGRDRPCAPSRPPAANMACGGPGTRRQDQRRRRVPDRAEARPRRPARMAGGATTVKPATSAAARPAWAARTGPQTSVSLPSASACRSCGSTIEAAARPTICAGISASCRTTP